MFPVRNLYITSGRFKNFVMHVLLCCFVCFHALLLVFLHARIGTVCNSRPDLLVLQDGSDTWSFRHAHHTHHEISVLVVISAGATWGSFMPRATCIHASRSVSSPCSHVFQICVPITWLLPHVRELSETVQTRSCLQGSYYARFTKHTFSFQENGGGCWMSIHVTCSVRECSSVLSGLIQHRMLYDVCLFVWNHAVTIVMTQWRHCGINYHRNLRQAAAA